MTVGDGQTGPLKYGNEAPMALLRGIETTAIGRQKTVEVLYEDRAYVDKNGKPVKLQDVTCYGCMNNYFMLADDPIDYCPHCGRREGTPWASHDEAVRWASPHNFAYMRKLGLEPFSLRRSDGAWVLGFGRGAQGFLGKATIIEARSLLPGGGGA